MQSYGTHGLKNLSKSTHFGMPRRQREEDEDYDASSVGSGRNQRVCVDNGAADGAAASEEAVLAALEQEASSAQDEAKILEDGAAVVQFLRNQTDEIKQGRPYLALQRPRRAGEQHPLECVLLPQYSVAKIVLNYVV